MRKNLILKEYIMTEYITINEMVIEAKFYLKILKALKKGLVPDDWETIRKINEDALLRLKAENKNESQKEQ